MLLASTNAVVLGEFDEPAKAAADATTTPAKTQAKPEASGSAAEGKVKSESCKSAPVYSKRQWLSLLVRGNTEKTRFFEQCYDLDYLKKEEVTTWLKNKETDCQKDASKNESSSLCAAISCIGTPAEKAKLAEDVAQAAKEEAKACKTAKTDKAAGATPAETSAHATPDKNTLWSCMTDYSFFDKFEEICKKAKLNSQSEGDYKVTSCEHQANLLLSKKGDTQELVQMQDEYDLSINEVSKQICDIARKCETDKSYKCEMSNHFIYYLLP